MNPILLLHGALGSKSQLEPIKNTLEKNQRIVYTMNFSGHSGEPFSTQGFGIEVFADDVYRFMQIHNLTKADIFGYSMGGYVALWFAFQYPDKVGEIVTLGTKFDWDIVSAEKEVKKIDPDKILAKVPAFARILEHRHGANEWKELLHKTGDMMLGLGKKPLLTEAIFKTIQHRVCIYLGDSDDMADANYSMLVAEVLPSGSFVLLQNTPHPIEKVSFIPFLD